MTVTACRKRVVISVLYVRREREAACRCTPSPYQLVLTGNGTCHKDDWVTEHVRIAVWTGCDHKWESFRLFPLSFLPLINSLAQSISAGEFRPFWPFGARFRKAEVDSNRSYISPMSVGTASVQNRQFPFHKDVVSSDN